MINGQLPEIFLLKKKIDLPIMFYLDLLISCYLCVSPISNYPPLLLSIINCISSLIH